MDDRELTVCRCEEVSKGEILEAIEQGAGSIGEVKRWTRAGMGLCQGKTCGSLVLQLLRSQSHGNSAEPEARSYRPPVRPVPLSAMAQGCDEND